MRIIYHSYWWSPALLVAVGIHLGCLPADRKPHGADFTRLATKLSQRLKAEAAGLHFGGKSDEGDDIYILGRNVGAPVVERAFHGVAAIFGVHPADFLLVDVEPCEERWGKWGGSLLRAAGFVSSSWWLRNVGLSRSYRRVAHLVADVRGRIAIQKGGSREDLLPLLRKRSYLGGRLGDSRGNLADEPLPGPGGDQTSPEL
jgi:hypothetical protein